MSPRLKATAERAKNAEKRCLCALCVLCGCVLSTGSPADAPSIWSTKPAPQWDHAYPVGNGRLGAMVFGTVNRERIQASVSPVVAR